MTSPTGLREEWDEFRVSLVRNDILFRLHRRVGLIPADGSGIGRRAVFWTLLCWLPLVVWAWVNGRMLEGSGDEALLRHLSVHARLLIGIPALHVAEGVAGAVLGALLPCFVTSGLVSPATVPAFKDALRATARARDGSLPWVVIVALALGGAAYRLVSPEVDDMAWALNPDRSLGFGAYWVVFARMVFMVLLLAWLWRLWLLFRLFRRLAALDLALVPTHADGLAGLGFLVRAPGMFAPVVFAISAVFAAHWGHQILHHGVHVPELRNLMIVLGVVILALFLAPNLAFMPLLKRTNRQAMVQYGTLIGKQGRLVHQRWITGQPVPDESLLNAPELGPVADVNALYEPILKMRPFPIGLPSVASILVPGLLPMIPVLAIEIPIKQLLGGLLKALL